MEKQISSLRDRYSALLADEPRLRIRDAADRLEVGESELLALDCGRTVTRLSVPDWHGFVRSLKPLGRVMTLTRNDHCVHEKTGCYEHIPASGQQVGLVTGKDIDLRLFYRAWHTAFAVETEDARGGPLRSFQIFDSAGAAVHKVYARDGEKLAVFRELVERFRSEDQGATEVTLPRSGDPEPVRGPLPPEKRAALLDDWAKLEDTHHFVGLLGKHGVGREAAIAAAEGRFTRRVAADSAAGLLEAAAGREVPVMVFVGNPGAIQIHTGPVRRIVRSGGWTNVLDPGFNLHLREEGVAAAWVVEKPTRDGAVTSLELLDAKGGTIVQFFGARKPGSPEREDWRSLVGDLRAAA
ncbi:MAG: hemin-degrading factor [Puniceicoccaceae bacterium]